MHMQTLDPTKIQPGLADPPKYATVLPRAALHSAILGLRIVNPGSQCWLNATASAWTWTNASTQEPQWRSFGAFVNHVGKPRSSMQAGGVNLMDFDFNSVFTGSQRFAPKILNLDSMGDQDLQEVLEQWPPYKMQKRVAV